MNKILIFLLGFLLLLHSCTIENKDLASASLFVDADCEVKNLRMSDLYSELRYIRLETSPESLISQVYKIIPFADRFLVVDRESVKIFLFGIDGQFISTIGNKGDGPEDFVGISDVTTDPLNNRIFVLDSSRKQVQVYGADGLYHEHISIDFVAHELEYLDKNMLLFYCDYSANKKYSRDGARPNVLLLDIEDGVIVGESYVSDGISFGEVSSPFSSLCGMNGKKAVSFDVLTNQLSFFGSKGVESVLAVDFGECDKVKEYVEMLQKEQLSAMDIVPGSAKSQPYTMLISCLANKNYCLMNAMNYSTGAVYQFAYSVETGTCLLGKGKRNLPITNDMDEYPPFIPYSSSEDCICGILEPYMLLGDKNIIEDVNGLMVGLKEDDNPIVVMAKTKPI